jgi:Sarcosine oxidase A3 domain/2Fe-2S iron-sulfur cluster binding domain
VGDCTGCLVRVNGVPNRRACRHPVEEGDVVRTENAWPSPRFDALGALDVLLPRGFDTVHGFRRPAAFTRFYQRVVRRLAGFGAPPDLHPFTPLEPVVRSVAVAVVGAGRNGVAVATALAGRGARPVVLERDRAPASGYPAGVEVLSGVTAAFLPPPSAEPPGFALVGSDAAGRGVVVRAGAVVVATGGYDAGLLFEGADRPGVVSADLALSAAELPLGRAVVVGGGSRAEAVLRRRGRSVAGIVAFGDIGPDLARLASEASVPLYPRSRVLRSLGRGRVRAVEVARRDGGGSFRLRCTSIVLAHRRLPNAQLLFQAGATRVWHNDPGAYLPGVDLAGRTGVPGLFAVGSAGFGSAVERPAPATVAAAVLGGPAADPRPPTPTDAGGAGWLPYYRELLRERRRGKWVVCPCEDVLLEELETASSRGYRGLEVVKRYTGVGTGLCQGRYCLPEAILVLALLEGRSPAEVGYITQRPPVTPTALGALAGIAGEFDREQAP